MVFDKLRSLGNNVMFPVANKLSWIHPDIITWLTFALSVGIGFLYYLNNKTLLIPIALLIMFSGFLDYLDGSIAKVTGKSSKRGDFLDHTLDRFSDTAIFLGITLSVFANQAIGFIAIIIVLLVSYMGTQAQALTGKRNYGGLLGRADRIIFLSIATVLQYFFAAYPLIEWFMWMVIIAGAITIVQRFVSTWKDLS